MQYLCDSVTGHSFACYNNFCIISGVRFICYSNLSSVIFITSVVCLSVSCIRPEEKHFNNLHFSYFLCCMIFIPLNYVRSNQIIDSLCNCNRAVFLARLYDPQSLCNYSNNCSPLAYSVVCVALYIPLTWFRSNGVWKSTVLCSGMSFCCIESALEFTGMQSLSA